MIAARRRQVVAEAEGVLVELLRVVAALPNGDGREHVVRAVRQLVFSEQVLPVEVAVADLHFLHGGIGEHLGPGIGDIEGTPRALGGLRRVLGAGHLRERVVPIPVGHARGEVILRRHLPVGTAEEAVLHELGRERPGEGRQGVRRGDDGARLVFAFVAEEVVQLVAHDRSADGGADLLVRIRQHAVGDEVLAVHLVVAEVTVDAAVDVVGPRARDGLHLDAQRSALGDVEEVRDHLELGNRLAAEARLAEAAARHLLRDLLPVEVQLELPVADRVGVDGIGGDALDLHRQLHPVAALQRQLLHLAAVDVAGDLRRADVDEWRLAGDGERLGKRRHLHGERHRAVLTDQQLHVGHDHRGEAGEFRLHLVAAGRHADEAVVAAFVAHVGERAPVGE